MNQWYIVKLKPNAMNKNVMVVLDSSETKSELASTHLQPLDSANSSVSSTSKFVLRPSALATHTNKLSQPVEKDGTGESSNEAVTGSNSDVASTHSSDSGIFNKNDHAITVSSSTDETSLLSSKPKIDSCTNFVFGENIHERVANVNDEASSSNTPNGTNEFSFAHTASAFLAENSKKDSEANNEASSESLTESAKNYESKKVKRTYEEVAVVTGEENESNVLQVNCKLYIFDNTTSNWVEKGRGMLRLNDKTPTDSQAEIQSRLVVRTQGSLRVMLNSKVWPAMSLEKPSPKSIRISAMDADTVKVYLVQTNTKDADQLFMALDWRIRSLKQREKEEVSSANTATKSDDVDSTTDSPTKRLKLDNSCEADTSTANNSVQTSSQSAMSNSLPSCPTPTEQPLVNTSDLGPGDLAQYVTVGQTEEDETKFSVKKFRGASMYNTKFNPKWTAKYPCIIPDENSELCFWCLCCNRSISCKHQGLTDVERHIKTFTHKKFEGRRYSTNSSDCEDEKKKKRKLMITENIEIIMPETDAEEIPTQIIPELCRHYYNLGSMTGGGGALAMKYDSKIYITPSGVEKEKIIGEDLLVADENGKLLKNATSNKNLKMSSCLPNFMHIFKMRTPAEQSSSSTSTLLNKALHLQAPAGQSSLSPSIYAVAAIHTHSKAAILTTTLFDSTHFRITDLQNMKGIKNAVTGRNLKMKDTLSVPIIKNEEEEDEIQVELAEALRNNPETHAILIRKHGLYVWGKNWKETKLMLENFESIFEIANNMKLYRVNSMERKV
ncbi:Methylthioribulose-1-phosphate dehydratase [Nymphon striatum]|nr:Methylthioribulose-1-phosphate dehydratase [Nymphon striatum]